MDINTNVKEIKLNEDAIKILANNNINTLEDVWQYKKTDLKNMGIADNQINQIRITLQLIGKDLNKKTYRIK